MRAATDRDLNQSSVIHVFVSPAECPWHMKLQEKCLVTPVPSAKKPLPRLPAPSRGDPVAAEKSHLPSLSN